MLNGTGDPYPQNYCVNNIVDGSPIWDYRELMEYSNKGRAKGGLSEWVSSHMSCKVFL